VNNGRLGGNDEPQELRLRLISATRRRNQQTESEILKDDK
jgi:hypothetical protein